jgi:hypothetical protein
MTSAETMKSLLSWIHSKQNPAVCPTRITHAYRRGSGLGSQVMLMANQMLEVIQDGGVYEVEGTTTGYVNPLGCRSCTWSCYVNPLSNCSMSKVVAHETPHGWTSCPAYNESFWTAVGRSLHPPATPGAGIEFYLAGMIQYLLRPSAYLHSHIEHARNRSQLRSGSNCVALHARIGDTKDDRSRVPNPHHPPAAYVAFGLQAAFNGGLTSFFVNSDSPSMVEHITKELRKWGSVHTMPREMFPLLQSASQGREVSQDAGRLQQAQLKQLQARHTPLEQGGHVPDEGAAILAQIILAASCPAYVGSIFSNVNRVAASLRFGYLDRIYDIDGGAWFACGASEEVHKGGPARVPANFVLWNASRFRLMLRTKPCIWTPTNACV